MQPACGHTASKATNVAELGRITMDGSPEGGSVKEAGWPTGTALAGPTAVPGGALAGWRGLAVARWRGLAVAALAGPAPDWRLRPFCWPAVPPASRPSPAVKPPATRLAAATAAVIVPLSTTSRRLALRPGPACSAAQSAMAASSDRTEPEPANSSGVQANANTMSAPV